MFKINMQGFYVIASIIYLIIFCGTIVSFIKFKHNITGSKIMFLGIGLVILSIVFFIYPNFKFGFPLLNFSTLLLGVILMYFGFCYKN